MLRAAAGLAADEMSRNLRGHSADIKVQAALDFAGAIVREHSGVVTIAALRRQIAELQGRNVEDGAVIVLDNASGEVLAWVGSSGSFSDAAQVDGVLARRQPGSTLKPFVYALAFEKRLITPASLIDDSRVATET